MNFKKFYILTDRLSELVDDQCSIFLSQFGYVDWLSLEQLRSKYPDFKRAKIELKIYIEKTLDELLMLFPQPDDLFQQALKVFYPNEQTNLFG